MAVITFQNKTFAASTRAIIEHANSIIREYLSQGFKLTLRQLYYQFVSRDLIANKQSEYKRLGSIVNDARLAGMLDWDAIEDRGRNLQRLSSWGSPEQIIEACASQYRIDLWAGQSARPEVWIEKEALAGVIEPTCQDLRVSFIACKGYMSQSEMFEAGYRRFRTYLEAGQRPVILHLGDHDPSGIDMTRDIRDRLELFLGEHIELRRLALNMKQVSKYKPPPNPAKVTDARFNGYQREFGNDSWELDALDPKVIAKLIRDTVRSFIDGDKWKCALEKEKRQRNVLVSISQRMRDVQSFLNHAES